MSNRKASKINIPMFVACVLLCLTLMSLHLMGGIYARYVSVSEGSDSARVAKFGISENKTAFSETFLLSTRPGVENMEIAVENDSEVAVAYTVTVKNTTNNIPYSFSIGGGAPEFSSCTSTANLAPDSNATVTVSAIWDAEGALDYMGMVDLITVSIIAQQID